jgi:hypothetical protein
MTERKYAAIEDAGVLDEQFGEASEAELSLVETALNQAKAKRGIKTGPDLSRLTDVELREFTRKTYGF